MFYVLVFSLLAVVLVVAGLSLMSRRRSGFTAGQGRAAHGAASPAQAAHVTHGPWPGASERRTRKAKRAQSQHDRRKRH
jgi:hypothetical protein